MPLEVGSADKASRGNVPSHVPLNTSVLRNIYRGATEKVSHGHVNLGWRAKVVSSSQTSQGR